jgi:dynein heavy chain
MKELRDRIVGEIALDEERKKNNPIQSSNTIVMKRKASNNVFEKLGFPEGMTYGHRSSLRKECSRFLRFAYLVDFLSLESLANIYIGSVKDMIERLEELDAHCDMSKVMTMDFDEANKHAAPPQRGHEPLFNVSVALFDAKPIPAQ